VADRRVLIVGGGIGGVTAALCFARQGIDVDVFEQANQFGEVGAGIQLSPNASRVLHDVGLEDALRAVAFLPDGVEMRDWKSGKVLTGNPLGASALAAFGAPYYHVHRADLMQVLVAAARASSRITLHTNARVDRIAQSPTQASVEVAGTRHHGDVVVGADGIRSVVRTELFGAESPTFTGCVAWRALVPVDRLPSAHIRPMSTAWWGPGKHFVHYYVRRGELVNCVCVVEKAGWEVESWTERGDHAELKRDFAGWHRDLQTLIDAIDKDTCFKWALFDRPPMQRWSEGRSTLLGDACHPTLPFMAQGAAMAIEDGAVLSRCVGQGGDVAESLRRYETLRRERTARIQAGSRRNATLFHLRGVKAWLRNRAVGKARGSVMNWLFSYDALTAAGDATLHSEASRARYT
jgi:2-polyprenyl-6-methoxyphenol hydroxylase-like FAD-dependent oxidoreductase